MLTEREERLPDSSKTQREIESEAFSCQGRIAFRIVFLLDKRVSNDSEVQRLSVEESKEAKNDLIGGEVIISKTRNED